MNIKQLVNTIDRLFQRERSRLHPSNVNALHDGQLSLQDRIALQICGAIGTTWAVYFFAAFMSVWMLFQIATEKPGDPYPFPFLLFIGNIVQLLLMPLIMVGQNIQGRHSELRAEEEYKTTLANMHDIEHVMDHLVALDRELLVHRELLQRIAMSLDPEAAPGSFDVHEGLHVSVTGKNED